MLKNYLKTAWRNLIRQRVFSAINIVGLAIGLATCLLISLFVIDELSYDRFNEKADRIVRVVFKGTVRGGAINEAHVMPPVAQALKAEYPEVEEATRIRRAGKPFFEVGDKLFYEEETAFADANIFDVFTLPMLHGNPKTALNEPYSVVITEDVAKKYFGKEDAVGQEIRIRDDNMPLKVTGVIKNIPRNSHFHFDLFASMASFPNANSTSWMESEFFTYLVLRPGYDYKTLETKLPAVFEKYISPQFPEAFGMSYTDYRKAGNEIGLRLQPLTDIHLHSDFAYDLSAPGDIRYVYIFGAVALFMLLIASINFMNLATAGASKRAREVGVRKVLGSGRRVLAYQFLTESILIVFISLLLAIGIVVAALPLFNHLLEETFTLDFLGNGWVLSALLLLGLAVGILSGSYPAFFLSAFKPVAVLKGKLTPDNKAIGLRSGLVVFQFFISIVLIFCTMVVYRQLQYIQHKKLGYDKEQVLILQTWPLGNNEPAFKQQLLQDARVINITSSSYVPAGASGNNNFFVHPFGNPSAGVKTLRYDVDDHYLQTLGIELKAGRNFSPEYGTDSAAVIINEAAAAAFGWKDNALGQALASQENKALRVIGVVRDFHFKSLHEPITPLVMMMNAGSGNLIVKIKAGDTEGFLHTLEERYSAFNPDIPLSYSFLDDRITNTYRTEMKTGNILGVFAGLTIFVACLGLFGLATFMTSQRTKEIGIRKVLGASVSQVVRMLSSTFVKLVLIAFLVATPTAWWIMNTWLETFAYRIETQLWIAVSAGVLTLAIALLTVGWQAVKAATANPVESLRDE
ncbi:ABC transporter permease [Parapedobacter lycopersici]|uniref:ABC transporter permease n=1 Tax=Parapedobacter lycopersici TaxID=1864939 RepID=UPI0033426A55